MKFVIAACVFLAVDVLAVEVLLTEDFESPSSITNYTQGQVPDNGQWVGSYIGAYATRHGMTDKAGGDFSAPDPNHQAYAFRYTSNQGITSAKNMIGTLTTGITYTVSFDVVRDDGDNGQPAIEYDARLMVFDAEENRGEVNSSGVGGTILERVVGSGTSDGSFSNITFTFTADPVANAAEIGKDMAVRFRGNSLSCLIDNVQVEHDGTGDVFPPAVLNFSPNDGQTSIPVGNNLSMKFTETVTNATGNITIRRSSDDAVIHTLDVTGPYVSISGDTVTLNPPNDLEEGVTYYVQVDAGSIVDLASNSYAGIADTTTWHFTTILPNGIRILYATSFEDPPVSGRQTTAPAGWVRSVQGTPGSSNSGLYNEDTGDFSTLYGEQAAATWYNSAGLTMAEATISEVLIADVTYTVRFSVAKANPMSGAFSVEIVSFSPGEDRSSDEDSGTILASVAGTAVQSDMTDEYACSFTPSSGHAELGKLIAVQIEGVGSLVDNLVLSDNTPPSGTTLIVR